MNVEPVTRGASRPPLRASALSAQQQRLWFLFKMNPGTSTYNIAYAARFRGPMDAEALHRAFQLVVSRHEALRTLFPEVDGSPEQRVLPFLDVPLPVVDLTARVDAEAEARRLIREEGAHPFDLAKGPLLRTKLLRLGPYDHYLLFTVHHIVFDGWSEAILARELGAAYGAFSQGQEPDLGDPPPTYTEIVRRQEAERTPAVVERSLAYWKERLAGAPPLLTLPTDHPRPSRQSYRGALVPIRMELPLVHAVKALARAERVSVFMVLAAALGTVLSRRSGQDDVSIGVPVAGRTIPESDDVIGLFVNTLVLRNDFSGNPTFRELLARVRDSALSAYEHQELPLEKLVEELAPERTLAHAPLFQVMLALQNIQGLGLELPGLVAEPLRPDPGTSRFDLTFFVNEGPLGFYGALEYATDLFERRTAERILREFLAVLSRITQKPDERIEETPLVPEEELHRITAEWNRTEAPLPEETIPARVEARLARDPEAAAVACGETVLTAREMKERSDRLARRLRALGAGPDVPVGLSVERSADMVVGLLGILKSGSAYLPLDPAYPSDRLTYMLTDSGAPLLVTERALAPRFEATGVTSVLIEEDVDAPGTPIVPASPEDLAYLIYTSGSTGRPKGVEVSHRALANLVAHFERVLLPGAGDVLVSVTTPSFDIAGLEIWLPLATGARLVVASRREAADGGALSELLSRTGATIFQATPTTYRLLLETGWKGSPSLTLLCGGEMVPRDLVEELLPRCRALYDVYGPTETTIWSAMDRVGHGTGPVPIGRPIANTRIYVVDAHRQPVPIGAPGELLIGGAGVARGYHARPDLTAERFVPDPFSDDPASRLYRTGDLARFLEDGRLEVLGRLDHQVKLRGFRIELGEVEAALAIHASVSQCAAAIKGQGAEKRLVAYVVPAAGAAVDSAELRQHLSGLLPDYMVPSAFVALPALPLTPNRKIDRNALPDPGVIVEARSTRAPEGEDERRLVAIFREVLARPAIGPDDDFFDSGGHSLLAVRLFTRIEKVFGRKLPLATIFSAPTPAALARILGGHAPAADGTSWSPIVPIQTSGTRTPLFCFHAVGGNVLTYFDLSRHLGEDQPVYGIQARGLDGREKPHESVEEMASCYAEEIRKLLPEGPYHLCGSSFGGLVAYEVARQLRAAGAEVGVLALFDTWGPDYPQRIPGMSAGKLRWERMRERVDLHLGNLRVAEGFAGKRDYVVAKTTRLVRELDKKIRRIEKRIDEKLHPLPQELRHVEAKSRWAMESYVPGPYDGPITLFRASRQPAGFLPDPHLGWTRVARGGLEVHEVPGYHGAIVYEPRVGGLARELARALAAFEARRSAGKTSAPAPAPEESYPLTPLQHGMVFHTLYAADSGVDVEQMVCELPEALDVARFRKAWDRVAARHDALRTEFDWEGRPEPVQRVKRAVEIPFHEDDLRGLPPPEREARVRQFLESDRRRSFDLTRAPLMRLTLFRLADEAWRAVWTFHHVILDGRSFPIVLRELFAVYDAERERRPGPVLPPERPYGDYIAWLARRDDTGDEAFWRRLLAGYAAPRPLTVGPRPPAIPPDEPVDAEVSLAVPAEETARLSEMAARHGLTLNTLVQGAWALLLSRYLGEEDVVFGATRACRVGTVPGAEEMVGLFINTLPVRARVAPGAELVPWLLELRAQSVAVRSHEPTPLVKVQEWSEVPRGASLFETIVVYDNARLTTTMRREGEAFAHRAFKTLTRTGYPLCLGVFAEPELLFELTFDRRRIAREGAERLLAHLAAILSSFLSDARARLGDLSMLDSRERDELIVRFNDVGVDPDAPRTSVPARVAAQAAATPDAIAVEGEREHLTYAALEARAAALAGRLARAGVARGDLVGVALERSPELVVALLGIMKAGAAWVPLELSQPKERLARIVEGARCVVTRESVREKLPPAGAKLHLVDARDAADAMSGPAPEPSLSPSDLAYVIYTSGSTGAPKGVEVTHGSLASFVAGAGSAYGIASDDVVLQFASIGFDTAVEEIFCTLTRGATLRLRDEAMLSTVREFFETCARWGITVLDLPTAFWHEMVAAMVTDGLRLPPAVRTVIIGGERARTEAVRVWLDRVGGEVALFNTYGPTEATVVATACRLARADLLPGAGVPIGRPLPNVKTYVLSAGGQPAPVGVVGELWIGGEGVARGYRGQPELTAERFRPDPFSPGGRVYRTGDFARFRPDGLLEFMGRTDLQVKVRGFRVEPAEVEAALVQHPDVREAVVVPRGEGNRLRLVAYVVFSRPSGAGTAELRRHLARHLPSYMVPAAIVPLAAIPVNANGKLDPGALPEGEGDSAEGSGTFTPPRDPVEASLAEIWRMVLKVPRVGVHDDYFQLGGHSLLALQIISRIERTFSQRVPLAALFEARTVARLAEVLKTAAPAGTGLAS